jgi:hypothetical protein
MSKDGMLDSLWNGVADYGTTASEKTVCPCLLAKGKVNQQFKREDRQGAV